MSNYLDHAPQEIIRLHQLVASWYRGDATVQPAEMEGFLSHLHPDFTMITPNGSTQGRQALSEMMESSFGSKAQLEINIDDIVLRYASPELAIFSYEEKLTTEHRSQRRRSTAVFTPAPNGTPQWLHLRETAVE